MVTCASCERSVEAFANKYKCRDCYNSYMREYMLARYHRRRATAIKLLGGECAVCGSAEDLEIDHIDPTTKTMDLGHFWSVSEARYKAELAKCQLLCGPHHNDKTRIQISVPHGGGKSGKKNCKCDPCRARRAEYMRNYRQAKPRPTLRQGSLV